MPAPNLSLRWMDRPSCRSHHVGGGIGSRQLRTGGHAARTTRAFVIHASIRFCYGSLKTNAAGRQLLELGLDTVSFRFQLVPALLA